jgi:hypothetical protein
MMSIFRRLSRLAATGPDAAVTQPFDGGVCGQIEFAVFGRGGAPPDHPTPPGPTAKTSEPRLRARQERSRGSCIRL